MDIIKKLEQKSLSTDDIYKIMGGYVKIVPYPDLEKYNSVDELFKDAPQLKQNIDAQAATAAKERAEIRARSEPKKEKTVTEFRQNVSDGRQKADAEAKAEAEAKVATEAAAAGTTGPVGP